MFENSENAILNWRRKIKQKNVTKWNPWDQNQKENLTLYTTEWSKVLSTQFCMTYRFESLNIVALQRKAEEWGKEGLRKDGEEQNGKTLGGEADEEGRGEEGKENTTTLN